MTGGDITLGFKTNILFKSIVRVVFASLNSLLKLFFRYCLKSRTFVVNTPFPMDRYPYFKYTILLGATRALAHIGINFTHRVFGLSTGVSKGPRNQKKKGIIIEADSREENENARQKEDTLLVADQEEEDPEALPEENTFMFAEDREQDDGSPINFSTPLAISPPIRNRDFREPGESSRGAQGNNQIMEMLNSIQKRMEERDREWNLQQKFKEEVYES